MDLEGCAARLEPRAEVVGTRILADGVIENADAGLSPKEIGDEIFDGLGAERARRIIQYARTHVGHLAPHA